MTSADPPPLSPCTASRHRGGGIAIVAAVIDAVQGAAARTGSATGEMADGVAQLTSGAEPLTRQIARFLERVRAA